LQSAIVDPASPPFRSQLPIEAGQKQLNQTRPARQMSFIKLKQNKPATKSGLWAPGKPGKATPKARQNCNKKELGQNREQCATGSRQLVPNAFALLAEQLSK